MKRALHALQTAVPVKQFVYRKMQLSSYVPMLFHRRYPPFGRNGTSRLMNFLRSGQVAQCGVPSASNGMRFPLAVMAHQILWWQLDPRHIAWSPGGLTFFGK
jgi:hypothetical protein